MQNACQEEKVTVEKFKKPQTSPPPPPTFCKMMLNCFNKSHLSPQGAALTHIKMIMT